MDWYYAKDNRPSGPVDTEDLVRLARAGEVGPETLVWNETMNQWTAYREVEASIDHPEVFEPRSEADAEPVEGRDPAVVMPFAELLPRAAAKLTDATILLALLLSALSLTNTPIFVGPLPETLEPGAPMPELRDEFYLYLWVLQGLYQVSFLTLYRATPGKLLFGMRVVFADGRPMNVVWALSRFFSEMVTGLTYMIGYVIAAFNPERRALHDFICGSRVVSARGGLDAGRSTEDPSQR